VKYDPSIILKFADQLYRRANSIIIGYTLIGALIGGVGGAVQGYANSSDPWWLIGAAIFGVVGFAMGNQSAFSLKLQAQTAMCQVQIEQNTRPRLT
jgi:F0F1-type ATP synthase assembly protein I